MIAPTVIVQIALLDASKLSAFRARLINKGKWLDERKVREGRRDFVHRVLTSRAEFIGWFSSEFQYEANPQTVQCSVPAGNTRLSESELAEPPLSTEILLAEAIGRIPPRLAALPAFWASYNLELLRRGVIESPSHFAKPVSSGPKTTGREVLERVLQQRKNDKKLEACARTLCRQMLGGVPEERGQVSVYLDPRIARAWWRGQVVRQAVEDLDLQPDSTWDILRKPGAPWEELIQHVVRKLTHVGERTIRSALVARFVEMNLACDDSPTRKARTVALLSATGQRVAGRSLGVLSAGEVLDVLRRI